MVDVRQLAVGVHGAAFENIGQNNVRLDGHLEAHACSGDSVEEARVSDHDVLGLLVVALDVWAIHGAVGARGYDESAASGRLLQGFMKRYNALAMLHEGRQTMQATFLLEREFWHSLQLTCFSLQLYEPRACSFDKGINVVAAAEMIGTLRKEFE